MSKAKPTYRQLVKRLGEIEPVIEALKRHEVDAVVGEGKIAFLLLQEVEEALLQSERGYRAMFDLSGVGMVQADTPGFRFTRVNPRVCAITGYSAEELPAMTWLELTHPEDRRKDMKQLARVLRGKTDCWCMEKRCLRKDGNVIWVRVNGTALRDDAGQVVRIVAMFEDVTTAKRAEQELRESIKELKKTVRDRTGELSRTIRSLRRDMSQSPSAGQALPHRIDENVQGSARRKTAGQPRRSGR